MSKKAIELSINFLVVFILTIVVFGIGIKLIYDWYNMSQSIIGDINEQERLAIENQLMSGQQVAIPFNTKTIERGKSATFGLGIMNTFDASRHFYVNVVKGLGEKKDPKAIPRTTGTNPLKVSYIQEDSILGASKTETRKIGVTVPKDAESAMYVVSVYICTSQSAITECSQDADELAPGVEYYSTVQKIYVNVP